MASAAHPESRAPWRAAEPLRLAVAAPALGRPSQAWLHRQLEALGPAIVRLLCWEREPFCAAEVPEPTQVPFPLDAEAAAPRWWLRARRAPAGNFYGAVGAEARYLREKLAESRPSVLLCHFGHIALRLLPVASALRIPLVAHFHGLDLSSSLRNRWYRWSLLRQLPRFDRVVVVGSHQAAWMRRHGVPEERLAVIPCGVPSARFTPRVHASTVPVRFVAVSRLVPGKGVDFSLRAFARVVQEGVPAELVVIGSGPEEPELRRLAEALGVARWVRFRGALSEAEVASELERSDVFVQHSRESGGWVEGFGVSVAEALACGLPVVATRFGGIPDQVSDGENGFLVAPGDVEAMADRMLELARDPKLRERLGTAGRARVERDFDTAGQVRKLETFLRETTHGERSL